MPFFTDPISTGLCFKGMLIMHVNMGVPLILNGRFCRSYCKFSLVKSKRSTLFHYDTYDRGNIFNFINVFSYFMINGSYMFLIVLPGFYNSVSFRAR